MMLEIHKVKNPTKKRFPWNTKNLNGEYDKYDENIPYPPFRMDLITYFENSKSN